MNLTPLHRSLEQELFALLRGASLECPVCGEFVLHDGASVACPECGMRFMEFRQQGRLGCPHDYEVFRSGLEALLERIHRATRHVGKVPRRGAGGAGEQAEVVDLRRRLRLAVESESYEEAARLRDILRLKGA